MNVIQIPDQLQKHIAKLSHDVDLQNSIGSLLSQGQDVAKTFTQLIENEGGAVIQKENKLSFVQDLMKIDVQSCKSTIDDFKTGLLKIRDNLLVLQSIVHHNVETCREKKHQYEEDICQKEKKLEYINERIKVAEKAIEDSETLANEYNREAKDLEESSNESEEKSKSHINRGIFGIVAGIALAPLTGGVSILAGSYAGGHAVAAGVNITKAVNLRDRAQKARDSASNAQRDKNKFIEEKRSLNSEIKPLEQKRDAMKVQAENLGELESFLYGCINAINVFCTDVQNVETVVSSALTQTQTLSIAQRANRRRPDSYKFGQTILMDLKTKWRSLTNSISDVSTPGTKTSVLYTH